jgi:capsular polysaccharide biosynthesis protein
MELKHYWSIIWRRWWLIAALLAVVLAVSLLTYRAPVPVYQATLRFSVGIAGDAPVDAVNGEGRSDVWLASEYLADDLCEVVKGGDFRQRLGEQIGVSIPPGAISATREHRIMTVTVSGGNPDDVRKIAEGVGAAIQDGGAEYFPQLTGVEAAAVLIDGPGMGALGRSLKDKLDLPIRLLIALIAGVALAFLWDYMDGTIRGRAELEALNVPILGEIPRPRRRGKKA